ncbi:MAG TPA: hypothetical protein VIY96_06015 [Thermoanaerobaculia bacterium]
MNYEVAAVPIPGNADQVESFEQWLEKLSQNGAELVSVAPSQSTRLMLCIFRVPQRGVVSNVAPPIS